MGSVELINIQQGLGNDISLCYNNLSQLAQSNVARDERNKSLANIRDSFDRSVKDFEANDKELRPPSHTLERNAYFQGKFVGRVRDAMVKFEALYEQVNVVEKAKVVLSASEKFLGASAPPASNDVKGNEASTIEESTSHNTLRNVLNCSNENKESHTTNQFGIQNLNNPLSMKNRGLVRKFEYVLGELEAKLEKLKTKDVSVEVLKEKYRIAEEIFLQYLEEFPDDDLTEIFYSLRDTYSAIPGIEKQIKSLPFTLPSIDIPIFSGKFVEWDTFRELFEQLIIDQPISNTQKMCILKSKLIGEAARKISKLPAREENFETAWNILKDYYSNNRATTSIYFKSVLDVPQVCYNSQSVKKFLEVVNESLQALSAMKIDANEMHQAFLCFVLQRKLDENLRIQFEQHLGKSRDLPKVDSLVDFLNQMHYSLEASQQFTGLSDRKWVNPSGMGRSWEADKNWVEPSRYQPQNLRGNRQYVDTKQIAHQMSRDKCPLGCAVGHLLFRCSKFRTLSNKDKWEKVMEHNICSRCLNIGHIKRACTSNFYCRSCNGDHHSLLHREKPNPKSAVVNENSDNDNTCVLLSTAVVQVKNGENQWVNCRVLLDSGSQVCLMTKLFKNFLKLTGVRANMEIEGLSKNKSRVEEKVGINLRSRSSKYNTYLDVLVIPTIVSNVPETKVVAGKVPDNIKLADPEYNIPKGIDMLIGAELFFDLMSEGQIKDEAKKIIFQNTKLGWIVSGPAIIDNSKMETRIVATVHNTCDELLRKFWEVEEIPQINKFTVQEKICEQLFNKHVKLTKDGKFQVRLPFKTDSSLLGNSGMIAKRRFYALERKLEKNQKLKMQYHEFLQQYVKLGHMEIMTNAKTIEGGYYLPHHCVLRPESSTTKLRVVFDASCKTTTNWSLNDTLHTGPRIQDDLFNILLRFRKHQYVFSADIEKMYRQIWVAENDRKHQLIFWRWNQFENLKTYALKTVTYGTASAPYLAVKCLQKISDLKANQFPTESQTIRSDFYMDDLMTGGDCLESVKCLRKNIEKILAEFGMPLRKWCANDKEILEGIPETYIEGKLNIETGEVGSVKALGVMWCPRLDEFSLKCQWENQIKISKRAILSDVAKLFDPLGLVGPVIVTTKILLQELWKQKLDWDEKVSEEMSSQWEKIRGELLGLNSVKVPRHIICIKPTQVDLVGFCDASMKAYGAVIYLRSIDETGIVTVRLVASKSRVAPAKVITLPRLELCAGVLLVELMSKVSESLKSDIDNFHYYTDSSIVLSWLKIDPARLQIFVSNRVSYIQTESQVCTWKHVASKNNPADLISRGLLAKEVVNNSFWFEGPSFLKEKTILEKSFCSVDEIPELKKIFKVAVIQEKDSVWKKINHRNNFRYLQNVVANVLKFINLTRRGLAKSVISYRKEALIIIVKDIQAVHFAEELKILKTGKMVTKSSDLNTLCPILDREAIIRVGGRLQNSNLSYEAKHPILVPYNNEIVELMMEQVHIEQLHVGPQGLLAIFRQQFWPLRGRQLAKKVVRKCYRCFKIEPRNLHQLMGNLPEDRVVRTRPFLNIGIDFLGPIIIHHKIRGKRADKSYVCVFVCFATKAVHLEVVSDLTSAAFIGALKRFVARRGCPLKIYSDNGTNFVGAANSLREIYQLFLKKEHISSLQEYCSQCEIEWLNIPARSPHIGGLWEASVKSVKKHFYRVSEGNMTYEELCTLMAQIESVLNSRPLTPLSDDPNDFQVLTPANFLIGECFSTFVDSGNNKCYQGLRGHWKDVQANIEEFWKRWSDEYLSELQKRYKWNKPFTNIQPGTLVLLKEDNLPPMSWRRGRVIRTILGSDGLCRMVDVRTSNGETKRSVHNVCPFPIDDKSNEGPVQPSIINQTNKNKNLNKIKNKNMLTIVITMLAIISPVKGQVDVINFKNQAGMFFEEIAAVGLTKTSWDIVVHINITEYAAGMAGLDDAMMKFDKLLEKQPEVQRLNVLQRLKEAYERILNRNEILISSTPDRRQKRAALSFVGSMYHSLFGLMDEEHAEALSKRIKTNEEEQEYLLNQIRNQSSIQDITLDIIKEQNKAIFENMEMFSGSFTTLEKAVNLLIEREAVVIQVTNMLKTLASFEEIQKDLIAAMVNTKGSFLHEILPVKKFKQQIKLIKTTINKKLRLPTETPVELAKLAYVTTRTTAEFMLFNIRIPLINADQFIAYAIQTYPTLHDNLSIKLQPSSSYILIDERKTMFYSLKEEDFAHCQRLDDMMLCPQIHPIYNTRETKDCEILLFLKSKVVPDSCEFEIKRVHNFWKQTHAPNSWIFSLKEDTTTEIKCNGKIQNVIIHGQGVLKMQPDCHLETAEMNLWAFERYYNDVNYVFPNFNLSIFLPPLTHIKLKNDIEIYKLPDIPKDTKILGFSTNLDIHHLTHYGFSFSTCVVVVLILIAVIWILKKMCQMSSRYLPATLALPRLI